MKVLVTGSNGYLGHYLLEEGVRAGYEVLGQVRPGRNPPPGGLCLELLEATAVERLLERERPRVLIHTAALADAGRCHRDPEAAERINAQLPGALARACARCGTRLLHVSTDLVFDGAHGPYSEGDPAEPVSVYGRSKLAGEDAVRASGADALICRIPLLYGPSPTGQRGASDMLLAVREGQRIQLFTDEYRSPLHVARAARALLALAEGPARGVVHVAARSAISRHALGLALADVLGLAQSLIEPVEAAQVTLGEPRARDVRLAVSRAVDELGLDLPAALEGVAEWKAGRV